MPSAAPLSMRLVVLAAACMAGCTTPPSEADVASPDVAASGVPSGALIESTPSPMTDADRPEWEPPSRVPGVQLQVTAGVAAGTLYTYAFGDDRLLVEVSRRPGTLDDRIESITFGLREAARRGLVERYTVGDRAEFDAVWRGERVTVHRVAVAEVRDGDAVEALHYLVGEGELWVRMTATSAAGSRPTAETDAAVRALLDG